MSWKDNLRPASFRGAPFQIKGHELETGRRGHLHEYPMRDKPYFEDLGLKAPETTVEGFLVGEDYMRARDALRAACEQPGAGTLVHPYLGSLQVVCTSCKITERIEEGRMARVQLTFAPAGENTYPNGTVDYPSRLNGRADTATTTVLDDFSRRYNVDGLPSFVPDSVAGVLGDISALAEGLSSGNGVMRASDSLTTNASTYTRSGPLLGGGIAGLVQSLAGSFGSFRQAAAALRIFGSYSTSGITGSVPRTTSTRLRQVETLDQTGGLITRLALIEEGRTFGGQEFSSYQEAAAAANSYSARVEDSHSLPGPVGDDVFQAMAALQADVVSYASGQATTLPQLRSVTLPEARPALAVAYDLYEDAGKDADIIARNAVRDPGGVPAGVPLEVLVP